MAFSKLLSWHAAMSGGPNFAVSPSSSVLSRVSGNIATRVVSTTASVAATASSNSTGSTTETEEMDYRNRQGLRGKTEADIIVIGSGLGGLCCGALLARYGKADVVVLESHVIPGGAAHSFERDGFHFDSGPSLFSGLQSRGPQANPLAQVLDAVGEKVECVSYDSWRCYFPEGEFDSQIGPEHFYTILEQYGGPGAVEDWRKLQAIVQPLTSASMAIPPASIRADPAILLTTLLRFGPSLLQKFGKSGLTGARYASKLLGPFSDIVSSAGVTDPFVLRWVDLLSFLLSGVTADGTLAAEIIYMFGDWYKPGSAMEYPLGGTAAVVNALVRGLEKFGGLLSLNCHVAEIVVEGGRATGVKLRNGQFLRARQAVVSNASVWDTMPLLPAGTVPLDYRQQAEATPQCGSFMHLHLGFNAKDAPKDLGIHHIVVNEWGEAPPPGGFGSAQKRWVSGVDSPQNVVLLSIPSVFDPSLAPPGMHALHAYTPGTEPPEVWDGLDRRSAEYKKLKEERSQVLWSAVARVLGPSYHPTSPLCALPLVGTPLTHSSFLRRHRGTYGPAFRAGQKGQTFPGPTTPLPGLFCCGDSTFPGIGVPAVAASGMVAANSLSSVQDHWRLLDALGI